MFPPPRWLFYLSLACTLASSAAAWPNETPLPPGALARFGSTRFRVVGADHCLAVSPDGKVLAAGGASILRLWDRSSGRELHALQLKDDRVLTVLFSPDSKQFAALVDTRPYRGRARFESNPEVALIVGEVVSGKYRLFGRGEHDHDMAVFTPDGKHLLTCGDSFSPAAGILWDVAAGKQVRSLPEANCYALSPDGKTLAGGSGGERSGTVHLWDVQSGAELRQLHGHRCPVHALVFSPDGRTLISASGAHPGSFDPDDPLRDRDNSVRLWDVQTGKERQPPLRHAHPVARLLFAPDGKTFVSVEEGGRVFLWDAATGKLRECFFLAGFRDASLLYSADGKHLIYQGRSSSRDNPLALYQWDIAAEREKRLPASVGLTPLAAVCSPDSKTLFTLGEIIHAWDIASGQEQRPAEETHQSVFAVDFAPDGKSLLVLGSDHSLRRWDIARHTYDSSFTARGVRFHRFRADRRSLLTIDGDDVLSVRDPATGRVLRRDEVGPPDSLRRWSPDGRVFATLGDRRSIQLWDAVRGEQTHRLEGHRGKVHYVTFSPDGRWLFSVGEDATLQWWDVRSGRRIERFHEEATDHVCYGLSQDGRLLAWACGERIHLWDLSARKESRVLRGHAFGTSQVELEGDGTVLISIGADDSTIRCWDTRTGQEFRAILTGNKRYPYSPTRLLSSPDGSILSYGGKSPDTGFVLLHPSTGTEICRTPKETAFELSPDGKIVVVAGDKLAFREVVGGGLIAEAPLPQRAQVRLMRFSSDGKLLLTAFQDGTHILWDWRRLLGLTRETTDKLDERQREMVWMDLASPDAGKGQRAVLALMNDGDTVVSLLRERLRSAMEKDRQRWAGWIADLDAHDFNVREKATHALAQLGVESELFLRRAAAEKVSLETRRRLEQIGASDAMKRPSGDSLRKVRAVQSLEGIGTPAARELLEAWSRGDADAWLTQEARSALRRLQRSAADARER